MREVRITANMVCKVITRSAEAPDSPERRLWLAVINQAAQETVTTSYGHEARRFFQDDWFEQICDMVGLNVEYVRGLVDRIDTTTMIRG